MHIWGVCYSQDVMSCAQVTSELHIVIYISCGISIVFLLLTITALLIFRYVHTLE